MNRNSSATNRLDGWLGLVHTAFMAAGNTERMGQGLLILAVSVAVWAAYFVFSSVIWLFERGLPPDLAQRAFVYSLSAGVTWWAGVQSLAVLQTKKTARWLLALAFAVAVTLVHGVIASSVYKVFPPSEWAASQTWPQLFLQAIFYDTPIVTTAFFALFAVHFSQQSSARERALLLSDLAARRAQMETLRYQLNPHFLFNTLNTISNIVMEGDREKADRAIVLLSKFLRRSIDTDPVALIPLSDEFQNVEDYLAIELVRFEGRLNVTVTRDPKDADGQVPSFLLQPVLENVIKHAVSKVSRAVSVRITSEVQGHVLNVRVTDDGPACRSDTGPGEGVGLSTTAERLRLIYGDLYQLRANALDPHGFETALQIPMSSPDAHV